MAALAVVMCGSALVSPASAETTRTVDSTAFCGSGTMYDGSRSRTDAAGIGSAAVTGEALKSWAPLGSKWIVIDGPRHGRTYQVRDKIGHGSEFDMWHETCGAAREYGRRAIHVKRVRDDGEDW